MENGIEIQRRGALTEVRLTRIAALNALNDTMRAEIVSELVGWARDPEVYAIALTSASGRAFSAGGDVRELVRLAADDPALAAASLAAEYRMNWALECFTKPMVSLIDGMVMGSGVGLFLYGTHRVGGQGFQFAMPETAIGLFPDVGVSGHLARMPCHVGRYLGLTGRGIGAATARRLGILTHCIARQSFDAVLDGMAGADPVDVIVDELDREAARTVADDDVKDEDWAGDEGGDLACYERLIGETFGGATIGEIIKRLEERGDSGTSDERAWCEGVLEDLRQRSPLSLVVTLRHLDQCRDLDLRDVLVRDYRLAVRFMADHDFAEGVRALLIDKDGRPAWRPATLEAVDERVVNSYFAPLGEGELVLPTREEMQNIAL